MCVTYTLTIGAMCVVTLKVSVCVSTSDRPDSHLIYTYSNFYKLSAGLVFCVCVCVCGGMEDQKELTAILFNLPVPVYESQN